MKRYIVLTMLALSSMSIYAYDFEVDGIYYNITSASDLTVEVTYQTAYSVGWYSTEYHCSYSGNIIIPERVIKNGVEYFVTGIGAYAFATSPTSGLEEYMNNLKSIQLPSSITTIGQNAFYMCDALSSLIIPSSVTQVGDQSFWCKNIQWIAFLSPNPPSIVAGGGIASSIHSFLVPQQTEFWVPSKKNYSKVNDYSNFTLIEMLTPTSQSFVYNGQAPTIEWTNNLSGYTMNVSDITLQKNAGSHSTEVKADFYKDDKLNFSVEFPYEYTISKATLYAKVNNASREYGEVNPSFSVTYSGFVNNEDKGVITTEPTLSSTATKTSNVGTYIIHGYGGNALNYNFVFESGMLTVSKAPLSAMLNDATKVYGSNNPSFTMQYSGLKNGETVPAWTTSPTFQTEATKQSGVGQYTVNAINGVPRNYDLGEITSGTLTIIPAPLIIKANNASRLYYNDNPALTYICSGFKNSDNETILSPVPTLSTTATQSSNVGTYEIKAEGASSPNYSISYTNGTLTITPRTLIASVGNYERIYNEENPGFEVLYSGFVEGQDEGVLNEIPVASTTATKTSNVGTYQIKVSGGSADNYTFSYTSGTLTINKAEQTISWNQDLSGLQVGDQVELKAVASSGLPVTYTVTNSDIAEIYKAGSKTYLDCFGLGELQIMAVQEGNQNYYSSPRVRKFVTIDNEDGISTVADSNVKIQGTSFGARVIDAHLGDMIRVYTMDGKLIHSVEVDGPSVDISLAKDGIYIIQVGTKTMKLGH